MKHPIRFLGLALAAVAALFAVAQPALAQALFALVDPHVALGGLMLANAPIALDPEAIQKSLDSIRDKVKEAGEKALAEAKTAGDMSAKTKEVVDELLVKHNAVQTDLLDVQQRLLKAEKARHEQTAVAKSIGAQFVESAEFKKAIEGGVQSGSRISVGVKNITTVEAGAGVAPDYRTEIISLGRRRFTIRDLMTPGGTDGNAVTYVRELGFTNNAAPAGEGTAKGKSEITLEAVVQSVVTIAHYMKASVQILADAKQLMSYIDGRLRYGLNLIEETQLLKGSGVGVNLNGIYTQATAYAAPIVIAAPTRLDTLRLMMLQAMLAEFPSTGTVLHPSDWAAIELQKDTQARYVIGDPQSPIGATLWGLPVVETQAMTVNTALVGAFRPMSQIFDREGASIVISTENEDDFIKNMVTIRGEERLASAVYRPEAFVKNATLVAA